MAKKGKSGESNGAAGSSPGTETKEISVQLPIEWHTGPEIATRYANQAVIQSGPQETYISFFETRPPHVTGDLEEMRRLASELKSIRAECVARIVVPHELLDRLAKSFQDVLERRQKLEATRGEQRPVDAGGDKKESA